LKFTSKQIIFALFAVLGVGFISAGLLWRDGGSLKQAVMHAAPAKIPDTVLGGAVSMRVLAGAKADETFSDSYGMAVDAAGQIWISDAGKNNRILRRDTQGKLW